VARPNLDVYTGSKQLAQAVDQVAAAGRIEAWGENDQGVGVKRAQKVTSAHVLVHQASHLAQHACPRTSNWFLNIARPRRGDPDRHGRDSATADLTELVLIRIRERVDQR
jgi:hypothetical protein